MDRSRPRLPRELAIGSASPSTPPGGPVGASLESFTITNGGRDFYVNDTVTTGDVLTRVSGKQCLLRQGAESAHGEHIRRFGGL